ncbi:MAG: hypothetical protein IT449_00290 [Phycisphaerales bacterium]|nr:hypothetical protein [Phycisphaerales bacterium]
MIPATNANILSLDLAPPCVGNAEHRAPAARRAPPHGGTLMGRRAVAAVQVGLIAAALAWSAHTRWTLARDLTWQCDELPLLTRFTGVTGKASTEAEARAYQPTFYNWRMGATRALRAPADVASIHTTTNFWVNLTTHVFGVTPLAGRLMPLGWSMLAAATGAWAAWKITREPVAASVTALLLALSPQLCAQGAEARGYAEATALAPVLPLVLEKLRRAPSCIGWVLAALAVALQLSLTVYTAWVYWVLPVMACGCVALPRRFERGAIEDGRIEGDSAGGGDAEGGSADIAARRHVRVVLVLMTAALAALMGVYTLDRWASLNFAAGYGGIPIRAASDVWVVTALCAEEMFPLSPILALLLVPGIVAVWRSPSRWWLGCMALCLGAMVLIALRQGSAGYPRNLGVILSPMMIVAGCGAGALARGIRRASQRMGNARATASNQRRTVLLGALGTAGLALWAAPAAANLKDRAHALILPDWGRMTLDVDAATERLGPRWICPCLANHATIHWYRERNNIERILSLDAGATIEVVLGAQRDEFGRPVVFRDDARRDAILAYGVPDFIACSPVWRMTHGIELRRWRGVRMNLAGAADDPQPESAAPMLVYLELPPPSASPSFKDFLHSIDAFDRGVVTFKPVACGNRWTASLIAPQSLLRAILDSSRRDLHIDRARVHAFQLEAAGD